MSKKPIDWEVITGVKIAGKRDETTWSLLDRRGDSFDGKTGALLQEGRPLPHVSNIATIFRHDPEMAGKLRYDEFAQRCWYGNRKLEDGDETRFAEWMGNVYGLHANPGLVNTVVNMVAMDAKYHPVRDYLDGLKWDGKERLKRFLVDYFGAEDTPAARAYGLKTLIACVARVRKPGAKVDTVLVLFGGQGKGKSTGFEVLCGAEEGWFTDAQLAIGDKDSLMSIQGKLIYEISELDSFRGRDLSTVKAFLSRRIDYFRPPFAHRADDFPRQTVFVGSTNDRQFLNDHTGSRRFWPVTVGEVPVDKIKADRDQLWAEADALFKAGTKWWLTKEEEDSRVTEAEDFSEVDSWTEDIETWLSGRAPGDPSTADLFDFLDIPRSSRTPALAHRVGRIMRTLGYDNKPTKTQAGTKKVRLWRRP